MAMPQRFYQRFYGIMSILLLLQDCHPVILKDFHKTKHASTLKDSETNDKRTPTDKETSIPVLNAKILHDEIDKQTFYTNRDLPGGFSKPDVQDMHTTGSSNSLNGSLTNRVFKKRMKRKIRHQISDLVYNHLFDLSEVFKNQSGTLEFNVKAYIKDCSVEHLGDILGIGSVKSPTDVITKLIKALLYCIAGCDNEAHTILAELIHVVGHETLIELLDTISDAANDLQKQTTSDSTMHSESSAADESDDEDERFTDEENVLLSGLLIENVLNTQEMLKLYDVFADGETYENMTEVETMVSESSEFSLEELLDQQNYKWMVHPSAADTNTTLTVGKRNYSLVEILNENATMHRIQEINLSVRYDSKASLLLIYDKYSNLVLSVSEENVLLLSEYDESGLEEQLWILDDGQVINIGSQLQLSTVIGDGNSSMLLILGSMKGGQKWTLYKGRLSYGSAHNCFIDVHPSKSESYVRPGMMNISVNCDINVNNVNIVTAAFRDANTPEKLVQYAQNIISDLILGPKFMIFFYFLTYIIHTSLPGYQDTTDRYPTSNYLDLQTYFFIKNNQESCKVLSSNKLDKFNNFVFEDFSEENIAYQLWYWKEHQIKNVATQETLKTNHVVSIHANRVVNGSKYFSLWNFINGTISTLNNRSCELVIDQSLHTLVLDCSEKFISKLQAQEWTLVDFDKPLFNNFIDVVCMFFIQSSVWPCESITVATSITTQNTTTVLVSPPTDNIFSQLWYLSNGNLVNVETGRALTKVNNSENVGLESLNSTSLSKWSFFNNHIVMADHNERALTIDDDKNGTLSIQSNSSNKLQTWNVISVKNTLNDGEQFQCNDDGTAKFTPFVIRNNMIPACQLLTVVERNGNYDIQMKHFDESILETQMWIMHRNHIINVATGLAIEPYLEAGQYPTVDTTLMPRTLQTFQQNQMWHLDENKILRWKLNPDCYIDIKTGDNSKQHMHLVLKCDISKRFKAEWSFTELPSDDEDFTNTLTYMCFYFIQLEHKPCQYVTADVDAGMVHIRPLVPALLERQIWYWNEKSLYLVTTGQYFGTYEQNFDTSYPWLVLINPGEEDTFISWKLEYGHLSSVPGDAHVSIDLGNDGSLFLSNSDEALAVNLTFINYDTFLKENDIAGCPVPLTSNTKFFFLRSLSDKCLVLSGGELGKQPTFEHFNADMIEHQLWFYENNHITNVKTNFVLHADVELGESGSNVTMRDYYEYANAQQWIWSGQMIFSGLSEYCVLDVDTSSEDNRLIVWCHAHGGPNQLWDRLEYDDGTDYIEEITCMFFLRHEVIPCELLTHLNGTSVYLHALSDELVNHQIWYWSGRNIINAVSGLAVELSPEGNLLMQPKDEMKSSQKWHMKHGLIGSEENTFAVIGLDSNTGRLRMFDRRLHDANYIKWTAIDLNDGFSNMTLLSCEETFDNIDVFVLRSEEDPCHLLTEIADGGVTLKKMGDNSISQSWAKIRKHLVSGGSGNALTAVGSFKEVKTQTRSEHDVKQHWYTEGTSLQCYINGHDNLLDAYGDVSLQNRDGSDEQRWVWLTAKDVKDNNKLLRCSKCYDKGEEKANEIISYIPLIGSLYSLIRAPVYAGKGCDSVALESLIDFAIGIAIDIGITIIIVLSGGTASAAALGIKTALQSGIKAGIKAAVKAISSSVSLAVRSVISSGKVILKQGLKKTVVSFSKKGLKSIKNTIKSTLRTIKHLPSTAKHIVVHSGRSVKKVSVKVFNRIRSTSYGSLKASVSSGLRKIPSVLKQKLNKIGNALAEKAEQKIKKLDDLKKNKPKSHVRCKRGGDFCNIDHKIAPEKTNVNSPKISAFIPNPNDEVRSNFNKLLRHVENQNQVNLKKRQNAHFGLSRKNVDETISGKNSVFDLETVHSKVLNEVDELPLNRNYERMDIVTKGKGKKGRTPQSHTEQALRNDMEREIKNKCSKGVLCELYLWTKNSPCFQNTYTLRDSSTVPAKSCFAMLLELCYRHTQANTGFKMCHIGFEKFFKETVEGFTKELKTLTKTAPNLATETIYKIPADALNKLHTFIKFYEIHL